MKRLKGEQESLAAFFIQINHNGSLEWQGQVEDIPREIEKEFRGIFELLSFMRVGMESFHLDKGEIRTWEKDEGAIDKQVEEFLKYMYEIKAARPAKEE